jgi:hypothetical protein
MQALLASDVVYSQRVAPLIQQALDDNDIHGQTIAGSKFLPSLTWLDAKQVGDRLNPDAGVGAGSSAGKPASGTHGHGLVSTKIGATTLVPGTTTNKITAATPLPVDVTFANQGQNDESNVTVTVKITGAGKPISASKRINHTTSGQNTTVTIQMPDLPPKGSSAVLAVRVKPVPGEKKTDNNSSSYTILFQ